MIRKIILAFSLLACAPLFAAPQIYHGKIVTNDQQFPFVVAVYDREGDESYCTGSVIADKWVLTASHCVFHFDDEGSPIAFAKPEEVAIGTGYLARHKSSAKKVITVKNIYTYTKNVDPSLSHDIALLELNESAEVTPVEIPQTDTAFPNLKASFQAATAIGYGWLNIKWSSACELNPNDEQNCLIEDIVWDNYLHYGNQKIQADNTLVDLIKKYSDLESPESQSVNYNFKTMLGAVSPDGTRTTHGDSGGPLILTTSDANGNPKYVQIGVVSWGILPISYIAYKNGYWDNAPDIYANLTDGETLGFIKRTVKN